MERLERVHGLSESVTNSTWWDGWKVRLFWIDHTPLRAWRADGNFAYMVTVSILTFVNLFVNIMNLFPIIPMDGGMIMKEICCLILPRQGLKIAFGISFFLALAASVFYLDLALEKYEVLPKRLQPYYPFGFPEFSLVVFLSMAYSLPDLSATARDGGHRLYMDDDEGYAPRAGCRRASWKCRSRIRTISPRAPGSERPRR